MKVPVEVQRISDAAQAPVSLVEEMRSIAHRIEERAFQLFEGRGGEFGRDLEDWLQAERDVLGDAASEMTESEDGFQLKIALPGFDGKDVQVTAMPRELVVEANSSHKNEGVEGGVTHSEFSSSKIFRKFGFAEDIDVDRVTAKLEQGFLEVDAKKTPNSKGVGQVA
ncbi:MAG: Hsp20 family protein [Bryobacteraceae bacterium]